MSLWINDACENRDVDPASNLIEQGYGVNDAAEEGCTPLIYVAFTKQVGACDVLIRDANVQARDGYD